MEFVHQIAQLPQGEFGAIESGLDFIDFCLSRNPQEFTDR